MSAIDQYGYECLGIIHCPSTYPIMSFNDIARDIPIYRLDEDIPDFEFEFRGKKGDILLGGGSGESAPLWIAIPEAFYWWTHEEWDEAEHWTDVCQSFWSATEAYVFCEGYRKLGWSPNTPIEWWLTRHILSFLVKHYPQDYQQLLGTEHLAQDGSICRLLDGVERWMWRAWKYGPLPVQNPDFRIIFCEDPLDRSQADSMYEAEFAAVQSLGIDYDLINFEALVNDNNAEQAVRAVQAQAESTLAVYRGWMLKPDQYTRLWEGLAVRDIYLINDYIAYRNVHYLPHAYRSIEHITPKTVWTTETSIEAIMPLLKPFGDQPIILKDYVKSQKHYWLEACFIPSASDQEAVERVVQRFLELQGDDLNEGLVFREFVEFEPIGEHSRSGMPLTNEFRVFWLDGNPIHVAKYWEEGDYQQARPPVDLFRDVANTIKSRFFTMDIARKQNGDWLIVELGDAQVAGLPEKADVIRFYEELSAVLLL